MRGRDGSNCSTLNEEHSEDIPLRMAAFISYKYHDVMVQYRVSSRSYDGASDVMVGR